MNPLLCLLLTSAQSPHALLHEALPSENGRKVGQISPGKNMIFPRTTAAFTISHVLQTGFVMLCSLTQGFGLICGFCSSARRFALRLLSDGRSPSRPCHRLVLFKGDTLSPFWNMYRGLTPHKIMPMPGTHNGVDRRKDYEAQVQALQSKIGQLTMENDFLAKALEP